MIPSSITQRLMLLLALGLMGAAPVHAQLTTPGLFKALKGQKAKGQQAKVVQSAKQIGFGLFNFDSDFGKMPSDKTVKEIAEHAKDGVKVAAGSANDCFFQLIVAGHLADPGVFSPDRKDQKRDDVGLKKLEHCFFSYIPGNFTHPADRPLVVAPLIKDKKTFDPKPLNGKAVVLLLDMSVHLKDIDEEGRVMINGKDIFDPKQEYWMGKEPEVKWPEH